MVIQAALPEGQHAGGVLRAAATAGLARASRREPVLDAAARRFGEHGYQAVSIEHIGAAAGISGAGIYNHVTAKSELLVAALTRAADALHMDTSRIFATASTPEQALTLLLRSYIDLTVTSSHLTGALITEVVHLPDEQRHAIRRLQHDYVGEWVQLLTTRRPGLTEPEARVITQAVLAIVNDLSRVGTPAQAPPAERRPRSLGPGRPGGTAAIGRFLSRRHGVRVADHALERARDDFDGGSSCSPPADTKKEGTP